MSELDKDNDAAEQQRMSEPWPSPGRKLRELRESRGMTQGQVGETLHLTMHYINALENDLYEKLPGKTFAKGYLKSYGALLGADVDDIIERFEKLCEVRDQRAASERPQPIRTRRRPDQNRRWVLPASLVLAAFVGAAWWFGTGGTPTARSGAVTSAPAPVPAVAAQSSAPRATSAEALMRSSQVSSANLEAEPAVAAQNADFAQTDTDAFDVFNGEANAFIATQEEPAADGQTLALVESPVSAASQEPSSPESAAGDGEAGAAPERQVSSTASGGRVINLNTQGEDLLVLHLSGSSWIEIDNGQNVRLYNDNLHRGDELTIRGEAPFRVLLGNAAMVEMQFNARNVDLASVTRGDNTARLVLEP